MNERIKQLWEKAATASAAYPSGQNNSWETQVNFMEKFAELIVGECADIAQQHNKSPVAAPLAIGYVIREHFGVEK